MGADEKAFRKGHKYFTLVNGLEHVPEAGGKIVFDKSRIARRLGKVVDRARRQETGLRAEWRRARCLRRRDAGEIRSDGRSQKGR